MPPTTRGAPSAPDALLAQGKRCRSTFCTGNILTVFVTVQDPALKNLMMAWYYAGYYTGLYEGRQQASQPDNVSDQK